MHKPIYQDILRGAEAIAIYVMGDAKHRRKIYHLIETGQMPTFRLGSVICARASTLQTWIEDQEKAAINKTKKMEAA